MSQNLEKVNIRILHRGLPAGTDTHRGSSKLSKSSNWMNRQAVTLKRYGGAATHTGMGCCGEIARASTVYLFDMRSNKHTNSKRGGMLQGCFQKCLVNCECSSIWFKRCNSVVTSWWWRSPKGLSMLHPKCQWDGWIMVVLSGSHTNFWICPLCKEIGMIWCESEVGF